MLTNLTCYFLRASELLNFYYRYDRIEINNSENLTSEIDISGSRGHQLLGPTTPPHIVEGMKLWWRG